jgi:acyl-CoA thioesterase
LSSEAPPPNGDAEIEPSDLAADTEITRLSKAPGWYTANLGPHWNFHTPSGGVLMAVALRAMQTEIDDLDFRPLSANTLFMSPVPAGPLEIRVELLRRGGAAVQLRAALSSSAIPGPGLEVSATFARERSGTPEFTDAEMPDVVDQTRGDRREGSERPVFFDNLEMSQVEGPPVFAEEGWESSRALFSRWYRYRVPQRDADGRLDRLALPPIIDNMPPAAFARIGSQGEALHAPSLDLTVHYLDDTNDEWLLLRNRSKKARGGFATADVEVWSQSGSLIAVGTQMMIFRSMPEGMPDGFRRSAKKEEAS